MKRIIDDEKSAIEYVGVVLADWGSWKEHHTALTQALETLLIANEKHIKETYEITKEYNALKLRYEYLIGFVEDLVKGYKDVREIGI